MLENIIKELSEKELYGYRKIVKKINALEENLKNLSNEELKEKTYYFKNLIKNGQNLNNLLPEAFAVIKEASWRVLGLRHFDVQLIGGCILHEGKIAEMKTGEGKTLVAILPAYLNALSGKSVHIITVNEYLAKRDSLSVGRVLVFLGLKVGLILENMDKNTRKENYACDVVYSTNSEIGFDYLRDNMITKMSEKVQKDFSYAIIDEVDSVLIDEARTPLIISQDIETDESKYVIAKNLSQVLVKDKHYDTDKKSKNVNLTEVGTTLVEKILKVQSLYSLEKPWAPYILNAIRAKEFYIKNKDYLIENKKVLIVDEFTGRVLEGRRWGEGLHQAIEAKEGIAIENETISLASITYQNFFLLYKKLSGMTGTAITEKNEFKRIYNLEVEVVPTNKKVKRIDEPDLVYKSLYSKWKAVLKECIEVNAQGRPILIGTSSVENSEIISNLLKEYQIKHNLLNAKPENAARESEIVAQAGRKGAVTIATNMAGRGTDILLGGNPNFLAKGNIKSIIDSKFSLKEKNKYSNLVIRNLIDELEKEFYKKVRTNKDIEEKIESLNAIAYSEDDFDILLLQLYKEIKNYQEIATLEEEKEVLAVGGLHIIGTERHESRRIDNQLRGRTGRQGNPGSSKFFLSLEDNLLQVFGGAGLKQIIDKLELDDDLPIEGSLVSSSLDGAQKKIESLNYETRKRLFNFDKVLNSQRKIIYRERERFLNTTDFKTLILQYLEKTVDDVIKQFQKDGSLDFKRRILENFCKNFVCLPYEIDISVFDNMSEDEIKSYLNDQIKITYELKELELSSSILGLYSFTEYGFLLQSIDEIWQEHLARMQLIKENIGWRSYGQRDPLLEYQKEAYRLFADQMIKIRHRISFLVMEVTSFA